MCRYYFGEGRCANSKVNGSICTNQEDCEFFSMPLEAKRNHCDTESWYGLYCAKYKRFFCPGKDDCQSFEQYSESLEEHRRSRSSP